MPTTFEVSSSSSATKPVVAAAADNQGTANAAEQHQTLPLAGLAPRQVETMAVQKRRALNLLRSKPTMLEKYIFLAQMRTTNVKLFYRIVMDELQEVAPIIYTPTVGTACVEYSNIYPFLAAPGVPDGLFLTDDSFDNLCATIRNYKPVQDFQPDIAVISDGSRILGLGDLGVGGIGIPIGKLQLYVACAGVDPRKTLPIILDLGTNNEKLRNDEFYLGLRQPRPADDQFYPIVDKVLTALRTVYPKMVIQFEDWSSEHAFGLLEKYQKSMVCFNDDIQGTGAVILSGVINAVRKVEKDNGVKPADHKIVFYGAGSAAIGVANQIQEYFQSEHGMSEEEAKRVFWIVDSKGMVTADRGDKLAAHKVYYARTDNQGNQYKNLMDIVNEVKPTVLIGLSSTPGAFSADVLRRMAELNTNPVVFPLSNPATQAECSFEQAMIATDNRVIFASGTAFPSFKEQNGKVHIPGQGNNMYIFPGLGLGAVLARPSIISDKMIYISATALADSLTADEQAQGWLYPSLQRIREVSAVVAIAVIEQAVKEGIAQDNHVANLTHDELVAYVHEQMWSPEITQNTSRF